MHSRAQKLACLAALLLAAGCAPEKPSEADGRHETRAAQGTGASELEEESVVEVDGEQITLADFDRRVQQLPEYARARYASTERRQAYLESVAQFEVMADRAEEAGFGERREVLDALKDALAEQMLDALAREEGTNEVDQAAIEAYYAEHVDEFRRPAARRVALILSESPEEAERIRERVEARLAEVDEDEAVTEIRKAAATHGIDRAIARDGGDVGFVDEPDADPEHAELAEAVFSLSKPGELTPVVAFDEGFAVATFFEEREAEQTSLETAASQIRQRLDERRRDEVEARVVDELRAQADVEIDEDVLELAERPERRGAVSAEDVPLEELEPFSSHRTPRSERTNEP